MNWFLKVHDMSGAYDIFRLFTKTVSNFTLQELYEFIWCSRKLLQLNREIATNGFVSTKLKFSSDTKLPRRMFRNRGACEIASAIRRAARYSIGSEKSCLRRSLLLWWVLEEKGIKSDLRVGVTERGTDLVGHSWVEIDGEPVGERRQKISFYEIIELDRFDHNMVER